MIITVTGAFLAFPLRLHFLNMGAVQEQNFQEIFRGGSGVDESVEAIFHEARQEAGMVDMGMGNEAKFDRFRFICLHVPVTLLDLHITLVHAAIHCKPVAIGLHDIT